MPTFSTILNTLITYMVAIGSRVTDFTSTSVVYQIFCAFASVVDQIYYSIQNAQNQAYVSTATGTGLDNKGADMGVPRKLAQPAIWNFTFSRSVVPTQQYSIPAGTVISTIPSPGQSPVTFTTNTATFLPTGTLSVQVLATCTTAGVVGNIAPGTQLLIGSAVPGIDYVALDSTAGGTYGTDDEDDESYRARLLAAPASKAQGTLVWYQQTALGVTGVQSVKVNPQGRGSGTVDIYVVGAGNALPSTTLINTVQSTIDAGRIITDDAKVFSPTAITVTETINIKVAADADLTATANLAQTAVVDFINNLGIGGGANGWLFQSQAMAAALDVDNVLNATTTSADVQFSAYQLPQATDQSITVTASY